MRSTDHRDPQRDDAPPRRVLLVALSPIHLHTLRRMVESMAEVQIVDNGDGAYDEAATHFQPQAVVVDLTRLGSLRKARDIAGHSLARGARIVFLGDADDQGLEESVSQEMGALYNPSPDDLMELVASLPSRTQGGSPAAPFVTLSRPGHPDGRGAPTGDPTGH
ncbi:MAG: hypothetical protein AVDCRST_MAG79-1544 [uncultured Thermoleophilia bacterium]|uniref:Response regulatory domain-containing protein n=1 Tax=uncultured Thermoleophilia bacterium TaxID=1497501 RepID=A0A6J4U0R8_9ACTN|nr:MAG: hypothetical protein AVDCRST_MAG79-1544 [uncultured Thermoleophilia bacterium]